jgi:hypothetical protein
MATASLPPSVTKSWKDVYVAALFESDCAKVPPLIAKAEQAIVLRARELFQSTGDHVQEEEALDDALYALRALRTCIEIHGRFADVA